MDPLSHDTDTGVWSRVGGKGRQFTVWVVYPTNPAAAKGLTPAQVWALVAAGQATAQAVLVRALDGLDAQGLALDVLASNGIPAGGILARVDLKPGR